MVKRMVFFSVEVTLSCHGARCVSNDKDPRNYRTLLPPLVWTHRMPTSYLGKAALDYAVVTHKIGIFCCITMYSMLGKYPALSPPSKLGVCRP